MRLHRGLAKTMLTSTLFLALFSTIMVGVVYGNIPSILEGNTSKENGHTILVIRINHATPSATHYVNMIEIDVNGDVKQVTGLKPQTSEEFEYRADLGEISGTPVIKVRAHCIIHGWGSWYEVAGGGGGGSAIPGFPLEAMAVGVLGALGILVQKRRNAD